MREKIKEYIENQGRIVIIRFHDQTNLIAEVTKTASWASDVINVKDPILVHFDHVDNTGYHLIPSRFCNYSSSRSIPISTKNFLFIDEVTPELKKAFATLRYFIYDWKSDESADSTGTFSDYYKTINERYEIMMDKVDEMMKPSTLLTENEIPENLMENLLAKANTDISN